MLKTKTIHIEERSLVLSQANILMSLQREELARQAQAQPDPDPSRQFLRAYLYPNLAACVVGQAPSLDEMLEMSDLDVDAWFAAAKELNPHWWPQEQDPKKASAGSSNSAPG